MERDRAAGSINCPPLFNGEDYLEWKIMMRAFLYSQDENMWNIVEVGWKHPTEPVDSKKSEGSSSDTILKPRKEWSEEEVRDRNCDFKARNSLFTALSKRERTRISHCDTAKKAWDLLEATYEGNKKVRSQKLQRLTQEFENMSMGEDELVDDFHARLLSISSQCQSLGDPIEEHRIVKKFLRSLPPKFQAKQTAIEEAQDLDIYPLDELVGNLKTFEMRIKPDKKVKNVAFTSIKKKENDENEVIDLALLTKEFKKFLKTKNASSGSSRNFSNQRKGFDSERHFDKSSRFTQKKNSSEKIKCFECGGFGHIAAECANRKQTPKDSKALTSTWDDSDEEIFCGNEVNDLALTSSLHLENSDDSESEEGFSDEEANDKYLQLYNATKIVQKKNLELEEKVKLINQEKRRVEVSLESNSKSWETERTNLLEKIKLLQEETSSLSLFEDKEELDVRLRTLQVELKAQTNLNVLLTQENEKLQVELTEARTKFSKFDISSEKVSKMIGFGRTPYNREGLGYEGTSTGAAQFVKENNPDPVKKLMRYACHSLYQNLSQNRD
ncbi:hypothetical protein M0R45_027210 [Rubus argutus]|uniref:CCHC-type domain-containing protein n=1 Tax=Rubus argutus TaxID=59490 RepID=A0AAW1WZW0_RUBAR